MKLKIKKYEEGSPGEFLLLREQLGMGTISKAFKKRRGKKKDTLWNLG